MNKIFYSLGASISSKLIILLINIIGFRLVVPEKYGFISLLLALTATIGAVANMGASVAVNSVVAKNNNNNLSRNFVKYNYYLSFLFSIILTIFICTFAINRENDGNIIYIFLFIFLFSLFSALNAISEAALNGMQKFKKLFINNFLNFCIYAPLSIYFIYEFNWVGVLLSLILYRFNLLVFNYLYVKKIISGKVEKLTEKDTLEIKSIFKNLTLPVVISGILVAPVIGFSFKILSGQVDGLRNLGYFNIVYQIYLVAVFIPSALNGYLISRFSKKAEKTDFYKIAKYNVIFSILVVLFLLVFKNIYFYIIGTDNAVVVNNFYIMLCTIVLCSTNAVFASLWPSMGKAWFGTSMNIVWAITLLTVTYLLSTQQIPESLSWGFLASYIVLTIIQFLFYELIGNEKSKTIWVLLRSYVVNLPPIMTVLQCLLDTKEYQVKFISTQSSLLVHKNFQEFIVPQQHQVNKIKKLKNYLEYRNYVKKVLAIHLTGEDLIWLGSLDTALACKGLEIFSKNQYILHLHELYDTHQNKLEAIKTIAQKAKHVVVPEINRAGILQVWLSLKERPIVFPNKPFKHPRNKNLEATNELTRKILETYKTDKSIILYQGHISGDRNLMPVAMAMKDLPDYEFWLLGSDHGYVECLLEISKNIKYLGSIPAPYHLEITSYASIGIMSYDLVSLNNLYCAPNKVWEYSGFNIPFLANKCLSLQELENKGVGVAINWESEYIGLAIRDIIKSVDKYKLNTKVFFDSLDLIECVNSMVE